MELIGGPEKRRWIMDMGMHTLDQFVNERTKVLSLGRMAMANSVCFFTTRSKKPASRNDLWCGFV